MPATVRVFRSTNVPKLPKSYGETRYVEPSGFRIDSLAPEQQPPGKVMLVTFRLMRWPTEPVKV